MHIPKGRIWLVLGAAAGIAVALGKVPYVAGAAGSLADTGERIVGTAGLSIIDAAARHGTSQRVVEGVIAVISILVPGVTALLLVYAARGTLRLRRLAGVVLVALGIGAYFYLPHGAATGVAALALVFALVALVATGPLVAAPLAGLAAMIAAGFLPRLVETHSPVVGEPVAALHRALFATSGSPLWLRVAVLVVTALPFALSARLIAR
jgi:hypothetical protein